MDVLVRQPRSGLLYHRFSRRHRAGRTCTVAATTALIFLLPRAVSSMTLHTASSSNNSNNTIYRGLSKHVAFHHLTHPVNSTQDEARHRLLQFSETTASHPEEHTTLAVLAEVQQAGRGTQGRQWERGTLTEASNSHNDTLQPDGNVYVTICVRMDRIPVTITLLPLQIAVLVAERVSKLIEACSNSSDGNSNNNNVSVKWPNDVLVDDRKISGTLIESETIGGVTWLLVGIGINVASAPRRLVSPGKHARQACCVQDYCDATKTLPDNTAVLLGMDLASALAEWCTDNDNSNRASGKLQKEQTLMDQWKYYAKFGKEYELRGAVVDEENGGFQGEKVVSVGIENDGRLRVRDHRGKERLLMADYLF